MLQPTVSAIARVVGATAAWLALLLLAQELGYLYRPLSFLANRSEFLIAVAIGFLITLWMILARSELKPLVRAALGVTAVAGFAITALVGALLVACGNGDCL